MTTVPMDDGDCTLVTGWHRQFLTEVLPSVEAIAQCRFRRLPPVEREEARAEAVAGALVNFVRLIQRGKNPVPFAGRLAKIAVSRVLSGRLSGTPDRSEDILARLTRQRRKIVVGSIDSHARAVRRSDGWHELAVEDRRSGPAEVAALRLDFEAWLSRLTTRRRQIAESLAAGNLTHEVARQFRLSAGRVSQMRRDLEMNWREFQGDPSWKTFGRSSAAA